jgi:HSP20 family protein
MVEQPISGTLRPPRREPAPPAPPIVSQSDHGMIVELAIPGGDRISDLVVACSPGAIRVEGRSRGRPRPLAVADAGTEGAFVREIAVPAGFDADRISATYERGVLWLTLPRTGTAPAADAAIE